MDPGTYEDEDGNVWAFDDEPEPDLMYGDDE